MNGWDGSQQKESTGQREGIFSWSWPSMRMRSSSLLLPPLFGRTQPAEAKRGSQSHSRPAPARVSSSPPLRCPATPAFGLDCRRVEVEGEIHPDSGSFPPRLVTAIPFRSFLHSCFLFPLHSTDRTVVSNQFGNPLFISSSGGTTGTAQDFLFLLHCGTKIYSFFIHPPTHTWG